MAHIEGETAPCALHRLQRPTVRSDLATRAWRLGLRQYKRCANIICCVVRRAHNQTSERSRNKQHFRIPVLAFDGVAFALATYKAVKHMRSELDTGGLGRDLIEIMLRDNILYFAL